MSLLKRLFGASQATPHGQVSDDAPALAPSEPTLVGRRITLSGATKDWVNIDELDLFGTSTLSPMGRFAIVTGSIIRGEPPSDGRRDGVYALLEGRLLRAYGTVERPHEGKVADNGAFVINDWMHGSELVGRFLGFHPNGTSAFSHQFSANLASNGISADGRYAACQTLSSPGSPDDTIVALFDLESGQLLARVKPACGTAQGFEFDTKFGRFHILTRDGDKETYALDGQMVDRPQWLDRRIARGDLIVIGSVLKTSFDPSDTDSTERLRAGLRQAATHGEIWTRARANRLDGELLEILGKPEEALAAYEQALQLDPQVGVAKRADRIRRLLAGPDANPTHRRSKFEQQADRLGIRHERIALESAGPKRWRSIPDGPYQLVEEAALDHFAANGWSGVAAEGGLVLTLIKAASFVRLAPRNADTYIEAIYHQNVAFEEDRFDPAQLVETVRRADLNQLKANWQVISATAGTTPAYYPRVCWDHVAGLFDTLGSERLGNIAAIFATAPYDLRAGWPDLTLWRDGELRFVEVKSPSDQMHASQARLISTILVPLRFDVTLLEASARNPIGAPA